MPRTTLLALLLAHSLITAQAYAKRIWLDKNWQPVTSKQQARFYLPEEIHVANGRLAGEQYDATGRKQGKLYQFNANGSLRYMEGYLHDERLHRTEVASA